MTPTSDKDFRHRFKRFNKVQRTCTWFFTLLFIVWQEIPAPIRALLLFTSTTSAIAGLMYLVGIFAEALILMLTTMTVITILNARRIRQRIIDLDFAKTLLVWDVIGVVILSFCVRSSVPLITVGGTLLGTAAMLMAMGSINTHILLSARKSPA